MVTRGTRVSVAALAVGLSLAGPQATGTAAADQADGETSSVSSPSDQGSPTRTRPSRSAQHGDSAGGARRGRLSPAHPGPASAADPIETAETVPTIDTVPSASGPRPITRVPARRPSGPRPDAPSQVSVVDHTVVAESIPVAAAPTAGAPITPSPAASTPTGSIGLPAIPFAFAGTPAPPVATAIASIGASVNAVFDSAANWLSGLPASPIADLLEGALLLVRRALFSLFPALGSGQTTGQAGGAGSESAMTEAELNAYLLDLAQQQYGDLFGQTVPVYGYGDPWPYLKAEADFGRPGGASDTNTQVDGVDEADFVENDGQYMYVAHNGRLTIVSADLTVASESALSGDVVGSYLAGDRLTVITQTGSGWYGPMVRMAYGYWGPWNPQTTVTVYDVSDRTAPTVVNQTVFDGGYQSSRAVDGVVYVVLQKSINLPAPLYTDTPVGPDKGELTEEQADALMKRPWGGSTITAYRTYETWDAYVARVGSNMADLSLPHAYSVDADGNLVDLGLVAGAEQMVKPHAAGQQSVLNVVSVDSGNATTTTGFADSVGALVSTTGATVYMTPDALYVASNEDNYTEFGSATNTRIDRFTVAGTDIGWQATGLVSGTLINQFAMDEYDGYLRVATHTMSSQWAGGTWTSQNDNGVYILDTEGETLDEVGRLTGLAPGEQLYAVRFMGDTAYLVTFLQTDPLFAIDVSDPRDPRLLGELVVPGFSNYLHSVGDGLLLGIGQEREVGGWNTHLHATLFDVRDGAALTQIDREFLDPGYQWSWSESQFDHHALLYSAEDGLLVVPVAGSGYDPQTGYRYDQFLSVLRVTPTGIEVVGQIHNDEPVLRTVRIGDVLYAVGDTSVTAYRISDLTEIGRTAPVSALV